MNFIDYLNKNEIVRFYFVYDDKNNCLIPSTNHLAEIAEQLSADRIDFDKHEGLFFELDNELGYIKSAAIHRTNRGQAAGGVRFWQYENVEDFIKDGMRLAKGMTYKNALAGLWWGGGKGVIAGKANINKYDPKTREIIYRQYGKFITSLNGCYVTAEDVGTNVIDMKNVFSKTRFTTCIPEDLGGSGNPSIPTAKGVISGMEAALAFLNMGSLAEKKVAVQGLGNVAIPMIEFLFEKGVGKIIGWDIFERNVNFAQDKFSKFNFEGFKVDKNNFSPLNTECDILSPCATGAILNRKTIPGIKAKIICGAANNQLANHVEDDKLLFSSGILYVPDFLTNRMGIVNCANEQYGFIENDPLINQHFDHDWEHSIFKTAMNVLKESKLKKVPTGKIALEKAEMLSLINHPIFGHRGKMIIDSLVNSNWEKR